MDSEANNFFEQTLKLRPQGLEETRQQVKNFAAEAKQNNRRLALVTSGGTTVPLEMNTVRFIDNFSSGTRGALCTEELLKAGYSVIFLHRKGSNFPFVTDLVKQLQQKPTDLIKQRQHRLGIPPADDLPPNWQRCFLPIGFTTIFEYLFLLRECCQGVSILGASAVVMLAAAVSDFYVPESDMATEKIQSRACDGLTISLKNVPKLLGAVRVWAPEAFIMSFKLETNLNILLAKAAGSLEKYGMDAVCSNQLQTIRDLVSVVERDPNSTSGIQIQSDSLTGNESEHVEVKGVNSKRIERGSASVIEIPFTKAVVDMHSARLDMEPVFKRRRTSA
eukprot:TRINITY_DN82888_c0_g1_i1.p1 TRINITY_DN82888_c0_g1~~TRINITY_DN82888_c0_g1_i1.p1  ORF type:complete len:334 (+),score=63.33 TRINITY_DN82888_c0_g1_i1:78-1079(+)